MNRLLLALSLLVAAGCMTRFFTGPARNAVTAGEVAVGVASCQTPPDLFDCRSAPAVATYLGDYLQLNGLRPVAKPRDRTRAFIRIFEDRGVVVVEVTLTTASGLIWRAEGQGDTLLRALVRLERLLADQASFRRALLTAPDVTPLLRSLSRQELSAQRNTFVYR